MVDMKNYKKTYERIIFCNPCLFHIVKGYLLSIIFFNILDDEIGVHSIMGEAQLQENVAEMKNCDDTHQIVTLNHNLGRLDHFLIFFFFLYISIL